MEYWAVGLNMDIFTLVRSFIMDLLWFGLFEYFTLSLWKSEGRLMSRYISLGSCFRILLLAQSSSRSLSQSSEQESGGMNEYLVPACLESRMFSAPSFILPATAHACRAKLGVLGTADKLSITPSSHPCELPSATAPLTNSAGPHHNSESTCTQCVETELDCRVAEHKQQPLVLVLVLVPVQ